MNPSKTGHAEVALDAKQAESVGAALHEWVSANKWMMDQLKGLGLNPMDL